MLKKIIFASLIFASLTTAANRSLAEIPSLDSAAVEHLTPSEMHRIMGEAKAERLSRFRATMAMAPALLYNQTEFDVGFYRIELKVDVPGQMLYGNVRMTAKSLVNSLDTISLDFDAIMTVDSVYIPGGQLSFTQAGYALTIILDKSYGLDEDFSLSVAYHGHPASGGFQGFSFALHSGNPIVSSLSEPYLARTWWPCKDRPDDKADSLDIFVTCDTALYCASNGKLIDTTRHGDGTWTFSYQVRYPITTYLFSVAISKYIVWRDWYHYGTNDSMEIVNHVYPDQYATSLSHWNITPYAIGVFANLFGEYPFIKEKYGHANFQWGGGMEHQTVTSMTSSWFGFYEPTVVHELSHQWWGDMITCNNWHDIWLNEGFASYSEALYYEVKNGKSSYDSYMIGMDYTYGGTIYVNDTTSIDSIFSNIVYDKGAWVLHMLRHIVGDATFFSIMQTYYGSVYKWRDVTSQQFKELCESVSGKDLNYFFDEWLYGTFRPKYWWSFKTELDPSDGKYWVYLPLEQIQTTPPEVFSMPIDLRFTYSAAYDTATTVIFNDTRKKFYFFKTDRLVNDVTLDAGNWILKNNYKLSWTYHLIPFPLDSGTQDIAYQDSIIVRGGSGTNKYVVSSGALPVGLHLDSLTGVLSGTPFDYGEYDFRVRANDMLGSYKDSVDYHLTVKPVTGIPGDVNHSGIPNIQDITFLINFLYKGGPPPPLPALADPNRDCLINIQDVTFLINYLYKHGPAPQLGCAPI
jgi:Peptidase family M1 domain/Peptidase M1 N-terminal domain/Putative Ig domain